MGQVTFGRCRVVIHDAVAYNRHQAELAAIDARYDTAETKAEMDEWSATRWPVLLALMGTFSTSYGEPTATHVLDGPLEMPRLPPDARGRAGVLRSTRVAAAGLVAASLMVGALAAEIGPRAEAAPLGISELIDG